MFGQTYGVIRDKNGIVYEERSKNNIVVAIRTPIIKLLGGFLSTSPLPFINQMKFGSGSTAPTVYDTALETPINGAVKILPAAPTISNDGLQVTFSVVFGENEMNDVTMREAALFAADNTMIARSVIGEYRKTAGMFFEFYWTIGFGANEA